MLNPVRKKNVGTYSTAGEKGRVFWPRLGQKVAEDKTPTR